MPLRPFSVVGRSSAAHHCALTGEQHSQGSPPGFRWVTITRKLAIHSPRWREQCAQYK